MNMNFNGLTGFAIAALMTVCCHQAKSQGIDFARTQIATQQIAPNFFVLSGSAGVDPGHPEGAGGRSACWSDPREY